MEEKTNQPKDPAAQGIKPAGSVPKTFSTAEAMSTIFQTNREPLKVATIIAIIFHVIVLWVVVPQMGGATTNTTDSDAVVVKRFKPPEPPKEQQKQTRRQARTIPIPDPTPDEPEPVQEPIDFEDYYDDYNPTVGFDVGIPDEAPPTGPLRVGGNVKPPEVINKIEPKYNDVAKNAGIEGVVILEAVIGADGRVHDVKVLRSLRFLDEEAIKAVKEWEFKPATLNGKPVDVYFVLTVNFQLKR
jgi:TonB family protein